MYAHQMIWFLTGTIVPSLVISCAAAFLVRRFAPRFGLVDRPGNRSEHRGGVLHDFEAGDVERHPSMLRCRDRGSHRSYRLPASWIKKTEVALRFNKKKPDDAKEPDGGKQEETDPQSG